MEVINHSLAGQLVYHPVPFIPSARREQRPVITDGTRSVRRLLLDSGIDAHQVIVVSLGDKLLTVPEWDTCHPQPGDIINVQAAVAGGDGDSNPLAIIASIALMAVAPGLGAAFAESAFGQAIITGASWTTFSGVASVASAVIGIAGNALISAIFRPHQPNLSKASGIGQGGKTYSLSGGSNAFRPYEPLPLVLGRHRVYPDYASKPYSELRGEDQYLYQAFQYGFGTLVFRSPKIGETDLTSYDDYTLTHSNVSGNLPFPSNVDTSAGGALSTTTDWIERTTGLGVTTIAVDFEGSAFYSVTRGLTSCVVYFYVQYRPHSGGAWVDAAVPHVEVSHTKTTKLLRTSFRWAVSAGQYDVRVKMYDAIYASGGAQPLAESSDKGGYSYNWTQLRSYQVDSANYAEQNRAGLIIKASGQLNGTLQQYSEDVSAKCLTWNGSAWVLAETSNPAWIFLYFARGDHDTLGRVIWGLGFDDSRIDIEAIKTWGAFCTTQGLSCNLVVDRAQTCADVLETIARCGLASPTFASGQLSVVVDYVNQSPVAMFGMSNICAGSFQVEYVGESLADEIVVSYIDASAGYQQKQVRKKVPGVTVPARSTLVELMGCTNGTMAGKYANILAAQQYYRRRMVSWESDFEAFVVTRGDVVLLSHDLTQWGYSGRVVEVDGDELTLDRAVPRNGLAEYLTLRQPDGTMTTYTVEAGVADTESDTLTLSTTPTFDGDYLPLDHIWFFSPLATPGKKLKIVSCQPISESRVRIVATDEYPEYYDAWTGDFEEVTADTLLTSGVPSITSVSITEQWSGAATPFLQLDLVIKHTGNYHGVIARISIEGRFISTTDASGDHITLTVPNSGQDVLIELVPTNNLGQRGAPYSTTWSITGKTIPPEDVTGFDGEIVGDRLVLSWDTPPDDDFAYTEIRLIPDGGDWEDGTVVATNLRAPSYKILPLTAGDYVWQIKAFDTSGNESTTAAEFSLTITAPIAPLCVATQTDGNYRIDWEDSTAQWPIKHYDVYYGSSAADTFYGQVTASEFISALTWTTDYLFAVRAVDIAGNTSDLSNEVHSTTADVGVSTGVASTQQLSVVANFPGTLSTLTGALKRTFRSTVTLTALNIIMGTAPSGTATFVLKKNGSTTIGTISVTAGNTTASAVALSGANALITTSDYITVDCTSASGSDAMVRIDYTVGQSTTAAGSGTDTYFGNVSLLLHYPGANNSTTFTDVIGHTVTPSGNAKIKTAQSVFGGSAGYFDGTGDWLTVASAAAFDMGTGDFTIETRVWPDQASAANMWLLAKSELVTLPYRGYMLYVDGNGYPTFRLYDGFTYDEVKAVTKLASYRWSALAVTRISAALRIFLNGSLSAGHIISLTSVNSTADLIIGAGAGNSHPFKGYMDETRITKGVGRYATTYTVAAAAFPDS